MPNYVALGDLTHLPFDQAAQRRGYDHVKGLKRCERRLFSYSDVTDWPRSASWLAVGAPFRHTGQSGSGCTVGGKAQNVE